MGLGQPPVWDEMNRVDVVAEQVRKIFETLVVPKNRQRGLPGKPLGAVIRVEKRRVGSRALAETFAPQRGIHGPSQVPVSSSGHSSRTMRLWQRLIEAAEGLDGPGGVGREATTAMEIFFRAAWLRLRGALSSVGFLVFVGALSSGWPIFE
ncbi:hypothetical protein PR002_g12861 [Phytophthora rubi]|uniref:Uncharacterized protein n=1 Tax=Phytophthora rubi TaxID=129364 RepID=A0A6A3LSK9_9STRA|nr:hypothetical protein PR002_g12861 [Phytophthora rubi]